MSGLYPVREASEEDVRFATDDADVLDLLQEMSGFSGGQRDNVEHTAMRSTGTPQSENTSQSWESAMPQPVAAQPKASKSSMQEMDSLLAAEKALEAELVGIDTDLLHKLPPEVARQLSQRAIVSAAAETAGRGTAPVDLLRRTTSRNSVQTQSVLSTHEHSPQVEQRPAGGLACNLSVNTSTNRRVSKTPSSLAGPNEGWRFTDDDVASQNNWRNQREGEAPFKGLNYKGSPPAKPDPAGLKYATQESQQEYRGLQEAGVEEQAMEWNVHQHVRPITDSEAAEMYNKSMDWKHRNALRYAELKRSQLEEELAQCTFSPKINESSKRLAHSARRPVTARGRPTAQEASQLASKGAKKRLEFGEGKRPTTASDLSRLQRQQHQEEADSECSASVASRATGRGQQLYERGMEMKNRQEQIRDQLRQAELADYKAHSPHAARLSPQIYGLGVQQRVDSIRANAVALPPGGSRLLHDPSLAECTFRPQTNFALSQRARPASAPKTQAPPAAFDLSEYEDLLASPESRQGSPNPRGDGPGLEALAQLASPASSRPQTTGGRSQASALAQLADVETSSWGPKGGSQAHSKYGSFSADLDFDEFLERQQRFLEDKKSKIAQELAAHKQQMQGGGCTLSQGTRRILQERQRHSLKASQAAAAMGASGLLNQGSEDLSGSKLIERLEHDLVAQTAALDSLLNPGSSRRGRKQADLPFPDNQVMTFKPVISKRSHELPSRSFEELSEGDRLRRDCYLEQMRLEALMKEEAQLTFKPSVNQYNDVRAQLNLRHPEAYLAQVDAKRQAQLAQRLEERRSREERELQECTFSPKIKTMPSYIHRIAKTRSSQGGSTSRSSAKYAERAAQRTREWV
ncbi:hypothetical protein WJX77_002656 [Trebouxia sp. C0004]